MGEGYGRREHAQEGMRGVSEVYSKIGKGEGSEAWRKE